LLWAHLKKVANPDPLTTEIKYTAEGPLYFAAYNQHLLQGFLPGINKKAFIPSISRLPVYLL
jgi:hypothetical protein